MLLLVINWVRGCLQGVGSHDFSCIDSLMMTNRLLVSARCIPGTLVVSIILLLRIPRFNLTSCVGIIIRNIQSAIEKGFGILVNNWVWNLIIGCTIGHYLTDLLSIAQEVSILSIIVALYHWILAIRSFFLVIVWLVLYWTIQYFHIQEGFRNELLWRKFIIIDWRLLGILWRYWLAFRWLWCLINDILATITTTVSKLTSILRLP